MTQEKHCLRVVAKRDARWSWRTEHDKCRGDTGKTSVAVAMADIEREPHAGVDVDVRQGSKNANWP